MIDSQFIVCDSWDERRQFVWFAQGCYTKTDVLTHRWWRWPWSIADQNFIITFRLHFLPSPSVLRSSQWRRFNPSTQLIQNWLGWLSMDFNRIKSEYTKSVTGINSINSESILSWLSLFIMVVSVLLAWLQWRMWPTLSTQLEFIFDD